jgi:hypothetical protein
VRVEIKKTRTRYDRCKDFGRENVVIRTSGGCFLPSPLSQKRAAIGVVSIGSGLHERRATDGEERNSHRHGVHNLKHIFFPVGWRRRIVTFLFRHRHSMISPGPQAESWRVSRSGGGLIFVRIGSPHSNPRTVWTQFELMRSAALSLTSPSLTSPSSPSVKSSSSNRGRESIGRSNSSNRIETNRNERQTNFKVSVLCDHLNHINFQVVVRVRPPLPRELNGAVPFKSVVAVDPGEQVITVSDNLDAVMDDRGEAMNHTGHMLHSFVFDYVYDQNCTQKKVYETSARTGVESALQGYNATIFACNSLLSPFPHLTFSPPSPPRLLRWPNRNREDLHHGRVQQREHKCGGQRDHSPSH